MLWSALFSYSMCKTMIYGTYSILHFICLFCRLITATLFLLGQIKTVDPGTRDPGPRTWGPGNLLLTSVLQNFTPSKNYTFCTCAPQLSVKVMVAISSIVSAIKRASSSVYVINLYYPYKCKHNGCMVAATPLSLKVCFPESYYSSVQSWLCYYCTWVMQLCCVYCVIIVWCYS